MVAWYISILQSRNDSIKNDWKIFKIRVKVIQNWQINMTHILRYGSRQREFLHRLSRNYSSYSISINDTLTRIQDTLESHSSTTKTLDKTAHSKIPSKSLTESYELGSVFASNVQQTRESQIKNELIILSEQKLQEIG